jgi:antitoxin VapB
MPIYIANQEAEDLAREVAAMTGETITDAVIAALRVRREALRQHSEDEQFARLMKLTDRTAWLIGDQKIDFDDLYDEFGPPK